MTEDMSKVRRVADLLRQRPLVKWARRTDGSGVEVNMNVKIHDPVRVASASEALSKWRGDMR